MTNVVLDRTLAIANKTDPFGNRWVVRYKNGAGLYGIARLEDEGPVFPKYYPKDSGLENHFTKVVTGEEFINEYLVRAWDLNDKQVKKAPAKERAKQAREESNVDE